MQKLSKGWGGGGHKFFLWPLVIEADREGMMMREVVLKSVEAETILICLCEMHKKDLHKCRFLNTLWLINETCEQALEKPKEVKNQMENPMGAWYW